jgi:hypothetical protein
MLRILKIEMDAVLAELAPLLNNEPAESMVQEPALKPEKIRGLFEDLEPLLKSGNPESLKFIKELRAVPESEVLIQQMENFDFELALLTFAELKTKVGLT